MGYLKQLRLLIHHKLLLRRRQPTILALELFWPAIVFMAVFFVRLQFMPEDKATCYYNSRALPSAGAVNLIQSLVCSIDNPCIDSVSYEEVPRFPEARIHTLVDHLWPLLTDKNVTGVIRDLPKGIRLMATIVDTLSQPEVKATLEKGIRIQDILRDTGEEKMKAFLVKALSATKGLESAQRSTHVLVNSSLNVVKMNLFTEKSYAKPLKEMFCSPEQLQLLIIFNDKSDVHLLSEGLCSLETEEIQQLVQLIQDELDFVKILNRLSRLMRAVGSMDMRTLLDNISIMIETIDKTNIFSSVNSLLNTSWPKDVPRSILDVDLLNMDRVGSALPFMQKHHPSEGDWLAKLSEEFEEVSPQFRNIHDLGFKLNTGKGGNVLSLVQLTTNTTLVTLIQQVHEVIDILRPKLGDGPIINTFEVILRGLHSIKSLSDQSMFQVKYRFRDLVKNIDTVKLLLEYHLGVEPPTIDAILNASIDFTKFVAEGEIDPDLLCNKTQLREVLTLVKSKDGQDIAPMDITVQAICTLSIAENYRFTIEKLKQLAVTKLMDNFVAVIGQAVLNKASLSKRDIPRALDGLKEAAKAMPYLKDFVHNFTHSLDLEEELGSLDLRGDGIDLLGSPEASIITAKLMCGKALPVLSNEFKLLKVGVKKPKISQRELDELPSEFCQSGYKQIMRMSGGPVVWSFLKPLLAGKVLYTPKTALTWDIMSRMNGTFTFMSGFVNMLHAWSQTIGSLEAFYRDPKANSKVQSVQHLVVEFLGKDVKGLFNDVDSSRVLERLVNSGGIMGLVQMVGSVAQCFELNRFIGYDTELELEEAARKYTRTHELIAGVVFLNLDKGGVPLTKLPPNVEYKIRVDIDFVPTTKMLKEKMWEPGARDNYMTDLGYFRGFVQVQELLDRAITKMHINRTVLPVAPAVHLQQFPYLCYKVDRFGLYIRALTPVIATVAWIFLIAFLIRERVLERELHLEEVLRVMGLKPSVAWLTWFLLGFVVMAFGSMCGLTILKFAQLLPHSDIFLLYLYFITFCFSIIMYCYMMSCFFKTATIASLSGIVAYLASYLPFMVAITLEHEMNFWHKVGTCFSMSTSFCFGMMYMSRYEAQGVGIQWSNIWQSPMSDDPMNFATATIMMVADGLIYFLIGWYISNVFPPGQNGHHEPWYFFLTPRYWGCIRSNSHNAGRNLPPHLHPGIHIKGKQSSKYCLENGYLESNWQRRPGMSLHNLYVIYNKGTKKEHTAVSNLTLELKEGQITTLLGRNGAGKTTTISVLTGQLPPTVGSVFVYGHQVPQEFSEARKLLGYCPQYNTLFKELTVREHLLFYSNLKGLLLEDQTEEDVDTMLHSTGLWHIQHELAKSLSGGLQRRLCVALAFVGGSKLIILDEPTSSVDPVARRSIWELIAHQKQSRTVLLTTHHMDEADILSDQVAVINRGKLLCNGSPLLLRSRYGCGYQLTVSRQGAEEVGDNDSGRASNDFHDDSNESDRLLAFTKCLIPNASLVEEYASEVILTLPHQAPDGTPHDYATFFRCLDANLHTLGFGSYGLRSTTLEEVFLTVCNLEEANMSMETAKLAVARKLSNPLNEPDTSVADMRKQFDSAFTTFDWASPPLVEGVQLKFKQLWALLAKRSYHAFRDWKSLFCNLFLPCLFIAFAMGITLIKPSLAPDPILPLSPSIYGRSSTSFYSLYQKSDFMENIADQLVKAPVKSHTCHEPRKGWKVAKCPVIRGAAVEAGHLPDFLRTLSGREWEASDAACGCNECRTSIDQYTGFIPEPEATGNGFIYNLSYVDVPQFLLRTYSEFNDRRYGGFTFHRLNESTRNENLVKVWFDNNGWHAMTSYLSAIDGAIMKANVKAVGLDPSNYSITTYSHPFHMRSSQLGDQSVMQRAGDAGIALIILCGFVFIPTSFVFYIVRERTQEEKQLQKIFGVGTFLYWFSSILWDMVSVLMAVGLSAAVIFAFQMPIYTARLNLPAVLLLLFLFGWAMTSLVYVVEKLFSESSIAFMVIYCSSLFVGVNTMVMRLLIDVFELLEVSDAFKETFERVSLIFPPYALMSGLVDITRNQLFADVYTLFDQDMYVSPFSMELLGPHYMALAIEGAVFFILNLIIEFGSNMSLSSTSKGLTAPYINEDSDVAEERRRVTQESSRFDVLRVLNVSKIFQGMFGKRIAVDHISFAVPRGECFGLLGVNGAGKTTLFRMLTGQLKPSSGQTVINRMNISKLLSSSCQFLGYCPQADALDPVLSPREHLSIYSEMRGIPSIHVSRIVTESLSKFQLTIHSDMPVSALSRGTRRKLCLAIAMIGSPQIVLLDEPTSGMDPMSRRCLWTNIQNAVRDRRSVLLTSHSMEECDILCSRLAIMVNGRFRCIGSPQYLKNKFGAGYTVTLRLSEGSSNWNEVISYMKQSFPSCILRAHHHNMLEFSLPTNDLSLSTIFSNLQDTKEVLQLQDFSVSQTTLDQVFVSFANQQVNDFHREPGEATNSQQRNAVYSNVAFVASTQSLKAGPQKEAGKGRPPPPPGPAGSREVVEGHFKAKAAAKSGDNWKPTDHIKTTRF